MGAIVESREEAIKTAACFMLDTYVYDIAGAKFASRVLNRFKEHPEFDDCWMHTDPVELSAGLGYSNAHAVIYVIRMAQKLYAPAAPSCSEMHRVAQEIFESQVRSCA